MKKLSYLLLAFSMLALLGCEEPMCQADEDCRVMCLTYENNALAYACVNNACRCVTEEAMICQGDTEKDKCQSICDTFYPGKIGACVMAKCECREAASTAD